MNRETELVLKTWYPEDHPLHYDLHHPMGKLVGEWGELLDDYMKHLYKPGYQWEPLNELVDIWYYLRILAYQVDTTLTSASLLSYKHKMDKSEYHIIRSIENLSRQFITLIEATELNDSYVIQRLKSDILPSALNYNYSILSSLCELFDLTIDQLTEASWEKLKPGSVRGDEWMKAGEYERR